MNRDELIIHYIPLTEKITKIMLVKYPNLSYDELLSYAYEGLIKAVDRYQQDKSSFQTYLTMKIDFAIRDGLREIDYLSRRDRVKKNKINKMTEEGKSDNEIKQELEIDNHQLTFLKQDISTTHEIPDIKALINIEDSIIDSQYSDYIHKIINKLPLILKEFIECKFFMFASMKNLKEKFNLQNRKDLAVLEKKSLTWLYLLILFDSKLMKSLRQSNFKRLQLAIDNILQTYNITKYELAKKLNVGKHYIYEWYNGKRYPSYFYLNKINRLSEIKLYEKTQNVISKILNISRPTLSRWENNKKKISDKNIEKLVDIIIKNDILQVNSLDMCRIIIRNSK